jgi:hypothetical protein
MYGAPGLWFDARLVPIYYDAFNCAAIGAAAVGDARRLITLIIFIV